MKSFLRTILIAGVPFGIVMGIAIGVPAALLLGFIGNLSQGVSFVAGISALSGLAFGIGIATFMLIQRRSFTTKREEFTEEGLLHDGPATHLIYAEGVGGWLYLTKSRIVFRSHKINIQVHEWSTPLDDIVEVRPVRTVKILPNGLLIVTRSGKNERFVVEGNKKWSREIETARSQLQFPTSHN